MKSTRFYRRLTIAALATSSLVFAGCGGAWKFPPTPGPADSAWPTAGADLVNSRRSSGSGASGTTKWTFVPGSALTTPVSEGADSNLYVAATNGTLYAISRNSGGQVWSTPLGAAVDGSQPAAGADGTIYIGDTAGNFHALDSNGVQIWSDSLGGPIVSSPKLELDYTVLIATSGAGAKLYALNGRTGATVWTFSAPVNGAPAIDDHNNVYVGAQDGKLYALNGHTGAVLWSFTTGGPITGTPMVGSNRQVYFGSSDGKVYAADGNNDGAQLWSFTTGGPVTQSPALSNDTNILIPSQDGNLYDLNSSDGTKKWSFAVSTAASSAPAAGTDGTVYVAASDGTIHAVREVDGTEIWHATAGPDSLPLTLDSNGTIYLSSSDGTLYAIR